MPADRSMVAPAASDVGLRPIPAADFLCDRADVLI